MKMLEIDWDQAFAAGRDIGAEIAFLTEEAMARLAKPPLVALATAAVVLCAGAMLLREELLNLAEDMRIGDPY
jgi:hypothetical protein